MNTAAATFDPRARTGGAVCISIGLVLLLALAGAAAAAGHMLTVLAVLVCMVAAVPILVNRGPYDLFAPWNYLFYFVILYVFLERLAGRGATLVLYPPFFACQLALAARRLHDQARGAGWLLLVLVPVLGPLVVAYLLLLRRGTDGENQHGPDPRVVGRDYLSVDAYEPG